jgi:hypothetical protein
LAVGIRGGRLVPFRFVNRRQVLPPCGGCWILTIRRDGLFECFLRLLDFASLELRPAQGVKKGGIIRLGLKRAPGRGQGFVQLLAVAREEIRQPVETLRVIGGQQAPKDFFGLVESALRIEELRQRRRSGWGVWIQFEGLPTEEARLKSLAAMKAASVTLLGSAEKLDWKQAGDTLVIKPVAKWPCEHAVVLKVESTR